MSQAAKALKSCPVAYQHPEQTVELVGVGPGIISFLVKKLEKHCRQSGQAMPERGQLYKLLNRPDTRWDLRANVGCELARSDRFVARACQRQEARTGGRLRARLGCAARGAEAKGKECPSRGRSYGSVPFGVRAEHECERGVCCGGEAGACEASVSDRSSGRRS